MALKQIAFQVDEDKFKRLKAIGVITNKTVKAMFDEMLDDYLAQFRGKDLGKKFLDLPFEEKLHRVVGQIIEGAEDDIKEKVKTLKRKGKPKA